MKPTRLTFLGLVTVLLRPCVRAACATAFTLRRFMSLLTVKVRLLSLMLLLAGFSSAQAQLFEQQFGGILTAGNAGGGDSISNASVTSDPIYVSSTPGDSQFTFLSTNGVTAFIGLGGDGVMRLSRPGASTVYVVRNANFTGSPTALMVSFDHNAQTTAGTSSGVIEFMLGQSFANSNTNPAATDKHSVFFVNTKSPTGTPGTWGVTPVSGASTTAYTTSKRILWVTNNSGGTLSYQGPDSASYTVINDTYDLWVGDSLVYDNQAATTAAAALNNFEIRIAGGNGTHTIDNLLIDPLPGTPTSLVASPINSNDFTANWTPVSGVTGYRLDVATDTGFTAFVSGYENFYVPGQSTDSAVVSGLASSTLYYYRVRAASQYSAGEFASGNSSNQSVTTTSGGVVIPTVTTDVITSILQNSATGGGNVTANGGGTVSARGVVWNTTGSPTLADNFTTDGSGVGTFVSSLTGLAPSTPYYVRAYATNEAGTGYGGEEPFATLASTAVFELSVATLDFDTVTVGDSPDDSTFVRNTGASLLTISSVASDNAAFSVVPGSASIPAGDSVKFTITFAPGSAADFDGNIVFTHDATGSPDTLTVSGVGEPSPSITRYSNGTGGGDWNMGTTWVGGGVPTAIDDVIIVTGDSVHLVAAGTCDSLTIQAGGKLALNAAGLAVPGSAWSFNVASTVYYNGPLVVPSAPAYGNLVYSSPTGAPNGDLTVNGNLTITTSTLRGISATTGTRTHTVAGNVIIGPGTSARVSAVNSSSSTSASVTWNIGGSVSLTGNSSGNRLVMFESAGPHSGTATYNIDGDLTVGTSSVLEFRTSSGIIAYGTGVINLKGNLSNGGNIRIMADGTAGTWALNMNGTSPQSLSGTGTINILSLTLGLNINNPAGVTLGSALTIPVNTTLSLTNGVLTTTDVNLLTIGAGTLTGGSAASYVNGPLSWTVLTGSPALPFPVGSAGNYSPVTVQFGTVSTGGSLKASTTTGEHPQIATSAIDSTQSLNRYYTLTNSGVAFDTYSAVFNFVAGNVDGGANPLNFIAQKYDTAWADLTEGTRTSTSTEITGATSFSDFAFGEAVPVPATILSNGTGGGNWNVGSTWVGGNVPTSIDDAVIVSGDSVYLLVAGTCDNLAIQSGGKFALNAATLVIPGSSWNFNASSTVFYNGTISVQSAPTYGNLVYAAANGGPNGNLTVNGNMTVSPNTMRGITVTTGSFVHSVAGNVYLPGTGKISGVNQSSATSASCVWNIGGSVFLTGNNANNRLILYESAGPHTGSSTFSIDGNLEIGPGSQVMFKSSSSTINNFPEGIINLKGNLVHNGPIGVNSATSGSSPGLTINLNGTSAQDWSGTGTFSVTPDTFSVNINVNNAAGVLLSSPRTINKNVVLSLLNGAVTTTYSNLLSITTTGTLSGGSVSSYVNGPLERTVPTGAATPVFPIGEATNYAPVTLSFGNVTTSNELTLASVAGEHPQIGSSGIDAAKSVNRYWAAIDSGLVFDSYDAVFNFIAADVDGGANTAAFEVEKYNNPTWTPLTAGTRTPTSTQVLAVTSFSDFAIGETSVILAPVFTASPSLLAFGSVSVGGSKEDSLYVKNTGTLALNVSAVASDNALFTVLPASAPSIAVGDSAWFYVTFAPLAAGAETGNIEFTNNGASSPDTVEVTGTGVVAPVFSANPSSLAFGSVDTGDTKQDSLYVKNTGNATLNILSATSDNAEFVVAPLAAVIAAGDSGWFYVTYTPTALGADAGNIVFGHDAATSPDTVAVSGTGVASGPSPKFLTVSPDTIIAKGANLKFLKSVKRAKPGKPITFPNWANVLDEVTAQGGFGPNVFVTGDSAGGAVIGMSYMFKKNPADPLKPKWSPVKDSANIYAWVRVTKWDFKKNIGKGYNALQKTLENKTFNHMDTAATHRPRGLDSTLSPGAIKRKQMKKQASKLDPKKTPNNLFAELVALKVNIAASQLEKTPAGFGELLYDVDSSAFDEMEIKAISEKADSMMTYWQQYTPIDTTGVASYAQYDDLYNAVYAINRAFVGVLDTASFMQVDTTFILGKLALLGQVELSSVPYLKEPPFFRPVTIAPTTYEVESGEEEEFMDEEWDSEAGVPVAAKLYQNYPNPFNPSTTISFRLMEVSQVTVKIYNMLGQEVATLFSNEEFEEGYNTVQFDAAGLSSGVYFYQIQAQGIDEAGLRTIATQKMVLLK